MAAKLLVTIDGGKMHADVFGMLELEQASGTPEVVRNEQTRDELRG